MMSKCVFEGLGLASKDGSHVRAKVKKVKGKKSTQFSAFE